MNISKPWCQPWLQNGAKWLSSIHSRGIILDQYLVTSGSLKVILLILALRNRRFNIHWLLVPFSLFGQVGLIGSQILNQHAFFGNPPSRSPGKGKSMNIGTPPTPYLILWMDKILHYPRHPRMVLPLQIPTWCEMEVGHPQ